MPATKEFKDQIKHSVFSQETFVRLTLKGKLHRSDVPCPWRQIVVRPVLIKDERYLQFSYFTEKQDITKNYAGLSAEEKLDEALALPFSSFHARSTTEDILVQITKKGKAIIHRTTPSEARQEPKEPTLAHNLSKKLPLPADRPDVFLQAMGILNEQGQVRPSMRGKFSQINEFLKLLEHTGELEHVKQDADAAPVSILDCGCGSAYLSFATYHYLNNVRTIPARLVGIDVNESLMQKDNEQSQTLGFSDACFYTSSIIDYRPDVPPDIVLALHACNTATDEALAQGIHWRSRLILCAPCCHHELNQQLSTVAPFAPVFRHGILKERLADILTDTFRALILRIMGYKTDVIEFVSSEHTDRNLMIRAVRRGQQDTRQFVQEYVDLKKFWGVTPYLEKLLGEEFAGLLRVPLPSS